MIDYDKYYFKVILFYDLYSLIVEEKLLFVLDKLLVVWIKFWVSLIIGVDSFVLWIKLMVMFVFFVNRGSVKVSGKFWLRMCCGKIVLVMLFLLFDVLM